MASKNPEQRQIQQAITAFAQGNFTQAAQLFEYIVKTRPQDQELKLWLASSHQQAGHLEEARQIYQFVLETSTRDDLTQAARNGLAQIQHLSSPPEPAVPPSDPAEAVADETAPPAHLLNRAPDLDRLAADLGKELDQLEEGQDQETSDLGLGEWGEPKDGDELADLQELEEVQSEMLADPVEAETLTVEAELDDVISWLDPLEEMPSEPLAESLADAAEAEIPNADAGRDEENVIPPIPADPLDTPVSFSADPSDATEITLDDSEDELDVLEDLEDLDVNLDDLNEGVVDFIDQIPDAPNLESISPQLEADLITSEVEGSEATPGSQVPEASQDPELQATELTQAPESLVPESQAPESQAPESQAPESQAPNQAEASDKTNLLSPDLPPPPEFPSDPTAASLEQAWEELLDYVDHHEESPSP